MDRLRLTAPPPCALDAGDCGGLARRVAWAWSRRRPAPPDTETAETRRIRCANSLPWPDECPTGVGDEIALAWYRQQAIAQSARPPPLLAALVVGVAAAVAAVLWLGRPIAVEAPHAGAAAVRPVQVAPQPLRAGPSFSRPTRL